MLVKKENRILTIQEADKDFYLQQGYDVVELKKGKYEVVEPATGGKTYTVAEYNEIVAERDALKAELNKKNGKKPKEDGK